MTLTPRRGRAAIVAGIVLAASALAFTVTPFLAAPMPANK